MPNKRQLIPQAPSGFFQGLTERMKLIYRLMTDRRVNPFLKLLPAGALVYWIIPDIAPGPIDDAFLLWLGTYLFVELCPPDIVQEHLDKIRLQSPIVSPKVTKADVAPEEEDIVDAEYWEEGK